MATIKLLTLSIIMLLCTNMSATNGEWLNLTNSNHITAIATQGNYMWVGSRGGGLAKIDLANGNKTFYNMANSGLPSNQLEAIAVDAQGNIWIGTYDQGLVRFDGEQQWEVFNSQNSNLARNDIYDIKVDDEGNVWLGTLFNLIKYDGSTFTDYPIPGYTAATTLLVLAPDDIYTAWYTAGHETQIFHFDGNTIDTLPNVRFNGLYKLYDDSQGRIWACYDGGVVYKDGNIWVRYDSTNSVLPNALATTLAEWNDTLWLGTEAGIYHYDGTTWQASNFPQKNVTYLLPVTNQSMYIGTLNEGLFKTNGGSLQRVQASNSGLPENSLSRIMKLHDGSLMMSGPWGRNNISYHNGTWTNSTKPQGLGSYQHMALSADQSMWYGGFDSIFQLSGNTVQGWDLAANGMPTNSISTLAVSPSGTVYVGTYNNGFFTFDGTNWAHYNRANSGISSNKIVCFAFVGSNAWIGTYIEVVQQVDHGGGIEVFDGSTFSLMHPVNSGLFTRYVSHLMVYGDSVWIGGDGGFGLYHNGTFTNYLYNNGSGSPLTFIKHMAINAQGVVFATGYDITSTAVMVRWDGSSFQRFDSSNTPLDEFAFNLFDMEFDDQGNLWLLHAKGVFLYKDGGVLYNENSPNVSIADLQAQPLVKVYPNPVTTHFTISLQQNDTHVSIFSLMGDKVYEQAIDGNTTTIDASHWAPGIYLYRIETPQGMESGKLIVN